ncbi:hypothetical protein NMY22_g9751 [Coprinellus aureogranulatus]|nr:hypothetical protein NMY22_g9751 [Coprinellus aureogranulatus]
MQRGSITDPSLHAAPTANPHAKPSAAFRQQPDQPTPASSAPSPGNNGSGFKTPLSEPRPASPYVFGDATPQSSDHGSQIRKLLRSPSSDHNGLRVSASASHDPHDSSRNYPGTRSGITSLRVSSSLANVSQASSTPKELNHMNGDHEAQDVLARRSRDNFDFSMRRHSIAAGAPSGITLPHLAAPHGTKRKLSTDRSMFLPVGEEIDPQLVGPGVPSIMEVDSEAPAPKRRGSTIDTQRIAQLSLEDRRNSVDSRMSSWNPLNDRRDSAPAIFASHSMLGFAQVLNQHEPPHPAKLPGNMPSFAWDHPNPLSNEGEQPISKPFDPPNQIGTIPPLNFPPDRRMSVTDTLTNPPLPPSRLRERSRPPSRQDAGSSTGPSSTHEDGGAAPLPPLKKEGSTPYSRSPELRVSHKLAERKRRKEMKELFDDLRDQLPQDRGMKASKWEILTKAIEYVSHLKGQSQHLLAEVEALRRENEALRQVSPMPSFPGPNAPPSIPHHQMPFGPIPPISAQFPHLPPTNSQSQHQAPNLPPIISPPSTSNVNQLINQNGGQRTDEISAPQPSPNSSLAFSWDLTGSMSSYVTPADTVVLHSRNTNWVPTPTLKYRIKDHPSLSSANVLSGRSPTEPPNPPYKQTISTEGRFLAAGMAPKQHDMSLLFHPKKKQGRKQNSMSRSRPPSQASQTQPSQPSPQKSRPTPPLAATASKSSVEDDETFQLPNTPYSEFKILSSTLQGWKYDVMKFDSRKMVDINRWQQPIKLNRKDLRRDDSAAANQAAPQAVGPMLGPDGKPVIGMDGRVVMVDAEGRPIHGDSHQHAGAGSNGAAGGAKDKGKGPAGKKRFQKKTRQVFPVPEHQRQLRKEERYPWVMEDSSPNKDEYWVGHLEEVSKADTHGFFMPTANNAFKFVPAHRWYKFQKKIKHGLPTDTANVDALYSQSQKRDPQVWLATFNGGQGASASTTALLKGEPEVKQEYQSLGPGGRRLKTVDSGGSHLFGDDDDEDGAARRRREKELGGEGDIDEQVYEEDFADDDEQMQVDDNDEEAKEREERLKREYQKANKVNDQGVDEDEDDDLFDSKDKPKTQKALEKMIRNREGNNAYESDEEKNPYASSEEEEEEEPEPVHTGPAIQQQPQQIDPKAQTPKPAVNGTGLSNSRANSPVGSPNLGGHSLLAQRATSPKMNKPSLPGLSNASRGNSPTGSRANSPTPSRATSPLANPPQSPLSNKRKADDSPTSPTNGNVNGGQPKPKKKKINKPNVTTAELEELLINWLKTTPNGTTRDCILHFNPYLVSKEKKEEFSGMVKRIAVLKEGVLALRPGLG